LKRFSLAIITILCAFPVRGHDFWIEPSSFRPATGQLVRVGLRVGEAFLGDPIPRDHASILSFVSVTATGSEPIEGLPGRDPAGMLRIEKPGIMILAFSNRPSRVDLPADRFEKYLRDEGLEKIVKLRAARGETNKPSSELFSRHAKCLIAAGGNATGVPASRPLGLLFELVPESDLFVFKPGSSSGFRLLFQGKPLEGALVVAISRQNPNKKISGRSDRNGRVPLRLDQAGDWLVKAVHMTPAATGSGAQWQSFWASVTFRMEAASPGAKKRASQ